MKKVCVGCGITFDGNAKKQFHSPECKQEYENRQRHVPETNPVEVDTDIKCPKELNRAAKKYWRKLAPILIKRGHLNVLSEDAFAELCDLHSRLKEINRQLDNVDEFMLTEIDERRGEHESAISQVKRNYSMRYMDYCKQFYLTPYSVRGQFGIEKPKEDNESGGVFDD